MIVVYRISPFTWNAGGRWLVRTRTFAGQPAGAKVRQRPGRPASVPEFVPWYGPARPVADLALDYLRNPQNLTSSDSSYASSSASSTIRRLPQYREAGNRDDERANPNGFTTENAEDTESTE